MSDYRLGFWSVIGFIEHLQIVTTSNYSAVANSHTLQFTTVCTNSSHSAVSSPVIAWRWIPTVYSDSMLTFLLAGDGPSPAYNILALSTQKTPFLCCLQAAVQ
jgi:hypothetical protein